MIVEALTVEGVFKGNRTGLTTESGRTPGDNGWRGSREAVRDEDENQDSPGARKAL